ncbi:expressed unknown protein [Seminavis robusta]|uniref:SH3 domain-containing protein n=1 Tax=Seminavis robusta TaxID=568900 RepID=A0A9N8HAN9_9STRA|nr:expressed unknown protein [Seminavis robusta]|eukprot:Sro248_g098390.1 n/a (278) ;mRNA; f:58797-59630
MKVISKYPFQAVPGMQQLSFPAGATIRAKNQSNQGGWMYGSYAGQSGWFPESYVERYGGMPAAPSMPLTPVYERQSVAAPDSPRGNRERTFTQDGQEEMEGDAFNMMGGNPGELFEGAPKPYYHKQQEVQEEPDTTPSFLKDKEEEPVDIYRHGPTRKHIFHRAEYTPVQITSAPAPRTPTTSKSTKVAPVGLSPTTAGDFWKAHPGRADQSASPEQAAELEKAFEGLRDSETIAIVPEEKKSKFPYIPKSLKKAAKKSKEGMKEALHRFPAPTQRA